MTQTKSRCGGDVPAPVPQVRQVVTRRTSEPEAEAGLAAKSAMHVATSALHEHGASEFEACDHNYLERTDVRLPATDGARICKRCGVVEVLLSGSAHWLELDQFLLVMKECLGT